jgi:hypothetical protein
MIYAIALVAFTIVPPASKQSSVIELLTSASKPNEFAVSAFAQLLHRPECLLEEIRQGVKHMKPGMSYEEVMRLLPKSLESQGVVGSPSFGFTHIFHFGKNHSLHVTYEPEHHQLRSAVLRCDRLVIERVGE